MLANSRGPDVETINQWSTSREKLSSKESRTPCRHLFAEFRTWEFWGVLLTTPRGISTLSVYWVSVPGIGSSPVRELLLFHFCVYQGTSAQWHSQWCLNSNPVPSKLLYLITEPLFLTTLCGLNDFTKSGPGESKKMLQEHCQTGEQSIRFALERGFQYFSVWKS